jgi:quinol monooxygenase YgiN
MIYGVVSVRVKPGKVQEYIALFKSIAGKVSQEKGCLQYVSTIDFEIGVPIQTLDKNVVTIIEKWENLEALQKHLAAPYMEDFFKKEGALVESSVLKMLQEA